MKQEAWTTTAKFEKSHFWFVGREEIILSWIDRTIARKPVEKILDYGCGTGKLVQRLQEMYKEKEVYGADISDKALSYCRKRRIKEVYDLKKTEPLKYFDLITCFDVLEHVSEDIDFLKRLKKILKPGGVLLMTVPAYDFLWSGEDYVSGHVRRYTRGEMKEKLFQAGFYVNKISYFNTFLFFPIVLVLAFRRTFCPETRYASDIYEVNRSLNKILTKIFTSEKCFLKYIDFPFGASIIVEAEK